MESGDFINFISSIINDDISNDDISNNDISNNDISNNDIYNHDIYNIPRNNGVSRLYGLINRINNITNSNITNNVQNILQTSLGQTNKYIQVISEQGLLDLEHLIYEEDELKKCPITYIDFKKGDKIIKLPCKHIFDEKSILQWLKEESNKCPVCRFSLDFKEKKVETDASTGTVVAADTVTDTVTDTAAATARFENFINSYYQRQEDRLVRIALQRSLIES